MGACWGEDGEDGCGGLVCQGWVIDEYSTLDPFSIPKSVLA